MKIIIDRFNIETTLEIWTKVMGYPPEELPNFKKTVLNNEWYDCLLDDYFNYRKDKDLDVIKAEPSTAYDLEKMYGIIDVLKEISGYDDLFVIVKDCYGDTHKEGYITFESEDSRYPSPPPLKGGEYAKKSLMTEEEEKEFYELRDDLYSNVKYTECYIERGKNYEPEKWAKLWIEQERKESTEI